MRLHTGNPGRSWSLRSVIRLIAGVVIIAAGVVWVVDEQLNTIFGGVQIVVGLVLLAEPVLMRSRTDNQEGGHHQFEARSDDA
ncbi:hypothetical protein [Rhodococcoides kyotonense]|uniref:Uncharacterized protein n=1 Tax=Rhodococcoides kyotonense TaxID=398843 RepID=A0A239MYW6_9NOCA|nr:hypothetical protein [Rhodococcus kyotonensis]SNT47700.1 hypothetical protein SAMN05421642_1252 [Rhodococcus kyotonensis]